MKEIIDVCLSSKSKNPIEILNSLMSLSFIPMHGPIHHILVGSSLLTAFYNAGGKIELESALNELDYRAKQVPGAACANWGACGAGISCGMSLSIILKASPLSTDIWTYPMKLTTKALDSISNYGGPRCCKRDSYLALIEATNHLNDMFNLNMEITNIKCNYSSKNSQCIKEKCPFNDLFINR